METNNGILTTVVLLSEDNTMSGSSEEQMQSLHQDNTVYDLQLTLAKY